MLLVTALLSTADAPAPSPRDAGWRSDIRYLAQELPKLRPDLFPAPKRKAWDDELAALERAVPSLPDGDVKFRLLGLVASLGDPTTRIPWISDRSFVVSLQGFSEGYRVMRAAEEAKGALGARLVAIGDTPLDAVEQKLAPLISCADDACRRDSMQRLLTSAEVLRALRLAPADGPARLTFEGDAGRFSLDVRSLAVKETNLGLWPGVVETTNDSLPLYMRRREEDYWSEVLPDSGLLYVRLARTRETEGASFPAFADGVIRTAEEKKGCRMVVDLRHTSGADESVFRPFVDGIKRRPGLRRRGRLFAIVGTSTYGGAVEVARSLRKAGAILVGEATIPRPKSPPALKPLVLPTSKLTVLYETDPKARGPVLPAITPDVNVETTFEDVKARRDPAIEAIARWDGADATAEAPGR